MATALPADTDKETALSISLPAITFFSSKSSIAGEGIL
jgi:hypothetical protein